MTITQCLLLRGKLLVTLAATLFAGSAISGGQSEFLTYSFPRVPQATPAGCIPQGNLVADSDGNLYGTTELCGAGPRATVFKLTRPVSPSRVWTETLIDGSLAGQPESGVIFDAAGNLYGTARSGGSNNFGFVFELSPPPPRGPHGWSQFFTIFGAGLRTARPRPAEWFSTARAIFTALRVEVAAAFRSSIFA